MLVPETKKRFGVNFSVIKMVRYLSVQNAGEYCRGAIVIENYYRKESWNYAPVFSSFSPSVRANKMTRRSSSNYDRDIDKNGYIVLGQQVVGLQKK